MIAGYFHQGSGLGNQLHRYVATRVVAINKGFDFGMIHPELFKGKSFMNLDMGKEASIDTLAYWDKFTDTQYPLKFEEKKVVENGIDIRGYDPEFNFIGDGTIIDGEFQDERYFGHRIEDVNEWLKVEPMDIPDDICVIGFRGGEFTLFPDLFLTKDYWDEAIALMRKINPHMKFEVHTDDSPCAQQMFPNFKVIHDIETNWRSMRYAKYAIVANSSFYILPRLLNGGTTIAPRYWARRNTAVWALPQNYYSCFSYI